MEFDPFRRGVAEFIGTFTLIFVGMGAIAVAGPGGLVGIALAHGLAIGVMVSALGHISGGHFNPAGPREPGVREPRPGGAAAS